MIELNEKQSVKINELLNGCTNIRIFLFEEKGKRQGGGYSIYLFNISNEDKQSLIDDYKSNFNLYVQNKEVMDYDLVEAQKEVIQKLVTIEIEQWATLIKQIDEFPQANAPIFTKDKISNKIKFSIIACEANDKIIYLVAKFSFKQVYNSRKIRFSLSGDTFKRLDNAILTFGDNIDCFVYDNNFYILTENTFNAIFKFNAKIEKSINESKLEIDSWDFFNDNTALFDNVKSGPRISRQFLKCKNSRNLQEFKKKSAKEIRTIIENDPALKIKFAFDGTTDRIVFDKNSLTALLKLFIDDISKRYFTGETIERGKTEDEDII